MLFISKEGMLLKSKNIELCSRKGRDFPGSPVVKTSPSNAEGAGLIPGWGAKVPNASWPRKPRHKTEAML